MEVSKIYPTDKIADKLAKKPLRKVVGNGQKHILDEIGESREGSNPSGSTN